MAEIVNLNRFRKARERDEREKAAAENRIRHGRPKPEREKNRAEQKKREKALDDKKLD
jgi:Domain of unknown function (DUF4169)